MTCLDEIIEINVEKLKKARYPGGEFDVPAILRTAEETFEQHENENENYYYYNGRLVKQQQSVNLFTDTKQYTYDPKSTPERVVDIRKAHPRY